MVRVCSASLFQHAAARRRLAGQLSGTPTSASGFNTQPPEGGWTVTFDSFAQSDVSTRSRPKAAGCGQNKECSLYWRFNTQPPEGGWMRSKQRVQPILAFQHAAARRRLVKSGKPKAERRAFQHAAARRRLGWAKVVADNQALVSTRSRPKAAGN